MHASDVAKQCVPDVELGHLAYGNNAIVVTCPSPVFSDQPSKVASQLVSALIPGRSLMAPARAFGLSDQETSLVEAQSSPTPPPMYSSLIRKPRCIVILRRLRVVE
jgi:hypothetical protein